MHVCMYVCMYVSIYMCLSVYLYVCTYVCMHGLHVCMFCMSERDDMTDCSHAVTMYVCMYVGGGYADRKRGMPKPSM